MKFYAKNTLAGLVPLYNSDLDEKRQLKLGETYEVEVKRPRNYQFHKKFFAMLNVGHANTSMELPFDTYRRWAVMKAGFVKTYHTPRGTLFEAESISFASMDNQRFEEVYNRVLDVIIKDRGVTEEEVNAEIINFL